MNIFMMNLCCRNRSSWKQCLCQAGITLLSLTAMTIKANESTVSVQLRSDLIADMKIIKESKMLEVNLTHQGTGRYLGFGWSPGSGLMKGSECVIGTSGLSPAKFSLSSNDEDASGVNRMVKAKQTLQNVTWVESDGKTILSFRKFLAEDGEVTIDTKSMTFIWAVGEDDGFTTHRHQGATIIELSTGTVEVLDPPHKSKYFLHGLFAFLAWGVFAPIAIAASLLRDYLPIIKGKPLWLKLHLYCNILSVIATVVTFAIVVEVYQKMELEHFKTGTHQKIGLFLFIAITFQALAGICRPGLPKAGDNNEKSEHTLKMNSNDEENPNKSDILPKKVSITYFLGTFS